MLKKKTKHKIIVCFGGERGRIKEEDGILNAKLTRRSVGPIVKGLKDLELIPVSLENL